ncbi:MAG: hypothetical protein AAF310_04835 [Myxococcota bacterium]
MLSWKKGLSALCGCCILLVGCSEGTPDLSTLAANAAKDAATNVQEEQAVAAEDQIEESNEIQLVAQEEAALLSGSLTEGDLETNIEEEEQAIEKCIRGKGLKNIAFSIIKRKGASECNAREKIILRMYLKKIKNHICSSENTAENGRIKITETIKERAKQLLKKSYLARLLKRVKRVMERRNKDKPEIPSTMPPPRPNGDGTPPQDNGDGKPPKPNGDGTPPQTNGDGKPPQPNGDTKPKSGPKRVAKICNLLNDLLTGARKRYFESIDHTPMPSAESENNTINTDQQPSAGDEVQNSVATN